MVFFAGWTVWSMPERFKVVCIQVLCFALLWRPDSDWAAATEPCIDEVGNRKQEVGKLHLKTVVLSQVRHQLHCWTLLTVSCSPQPWGQSSHIRCLTSPLQNCTSVLLMLFVLVLTSLRCHWLPLWRPSSFPSSTSSGLGYDVTLVLTKHMRVLK